MSTATPVFLSGSTMRHVLVMTSAASIGLLAMFAVDVVDMYFITLLGEQQLVAAVGFAGTLFYFLMSLGIGLTIALGALVARAEGERDRLKAGRYCTTVLSFNALFSTCCAALAWIWLPELLQLLGASGATLDYAVTYARIQLPSVPLMVVGMSFGAGMRAIGDARRSMSTVLAGAVTNAALDPLFIFYFDWGLEGAAWASVVSRVVVFTYAGVVLFRVHHLPAPASPAIMRGLFASILAIALPAVLTNLATPLGAALVLRIMAQFGDSAVAAMAVMGRLAPFAFAAVFAVSGAVGPIVGQNAGACRYDRAHRTILDAAMFIVVYVFVVWMLFLLAADFVVTHFAVTEVAADLLSFYIHFLVGFFALNGLLFVANASFNNLGKAYLATLFNYAKVLLGAVPAAYLGAQWYGPRGVMLGEAIGMALFGVLGLISAVALVKRLARDYAPLEESAG